MAFNVPQDLKDRLEKAVEQERTRRAAPRPAAPPAPRRQIPQSPFIPDFTGTGIQTTQDVDIAGRTNLLRQQFQQASAQQTAARQRQSDFANIIGQFSQPPTQENLLSRTPIRSQFLQNVAPESVAELSPAQRLLVEGQFRNPNFEPANLRQALARGASAVTAPIQEAGRLAGVGFGRSLEDLETATNVGAGIVRDPIGFFGEPGTGALAGGNIGSALSRAEEIGKSPTGITLNRGLEAVGLEPIRRGPRFVGSLDIGREAARAVGDPLNLLPGIGLVDEIGDVARAVGREVGTGVRAATAPFREAGERAIREGVAPRGVREFGQAIEQFDPRVARREPTTAGQLVDRPVDPADIARGRAAEPPPLDPEIIRNDPLVLAAQRDLDEVTARLTRGPSGTIQTNRANTATLEELGQASLRLEQANASVGAQFDVGGADRLLRQRARNLEELQFFRASQAERTSGKFKAERAQEMQGRMGAADLAREEFPILTSRMNALNDFVAANIPDDPVLPLVRRGEDVARPTPGTPRASTIDDLPPGNPPDSPPGQIDHVHDADPSGGLPPQEPPAPPRDGAPPPPTPPAQPENILDEIAKVATKGEKPIVTLMRRHQGAIETLGNESKIILDDGNDILRQFNVGKNVQGHLVPTLDEALVPGFTMDDLFAALHAPSRVDAGDIVIPPEVRSTYDELRRLTDWEEAARVDFDPEMATVEDYFYRGWKPPDGMFTDTGQLASGQVGRRAAFQQERVQLGYEQMRELGFEPLSANPFEQWRVSRIQGIRYREQMTLVENLKELEIAIPHEGGAVQEGWRTPKIGPAFEGKPFAFEVEGQAQQGFTRRWIVPNEVANRLENIYGTPISLGTVNVLGKDIDILKAIDAVTFIPKRAKLFGSLFQQVDFMTRAGVGAWAGAFDALRAGQPIEAARRIAVLPKSTAEIVRANVSPGFRRTLRQQALDTTPLIDGQPGVHLRGISEAGWSQMDPTLLPKDLDDVAKSVANEMGALGQTRKVKRLIVNMESSMRRGLFEGVYPAAQISDIRNNIAPMVARMNPGATAAQINGEIARIVNLKYSTIPASQSAFQNRAVREFLRRAMFSVGESEGLLRQAVGLVKGQNKAFWATHFIGAYAFLIATANAVHFASTGEPLPLERYAPISKDPFGPLPFGYNSSFAAPDIPIEGRNGNQLTLDVVGQLDTAFRVLDPVGFLTSRESVPVRAFVSQATGEDFYGQRIDRVGPGGIISRTQALVSDLGAPIGPGSAALEIARQTVPGAAGVIPESEGRLGVVGSAAQAPGLNLRAEQTPDLRNRKAQEFAERLRPNNPDSITEWDDLTRAEQVRIRELDPEFDQELGLRRETAGLRDPLRQVQNEVSDRRNLEIRQAATDFADNPEQFRRQVSEIATRAREQGEILSQIRGTEFEARNDIQANTDRFFALFDESETVARETGELPSDAFDRLEAELIADIGRPAWEKVQENIYTVTDLDAPIMFKRLQETKLGLSTEGFWDLRNQVWEELRASIPKLAEFASVSAYRRSIAQQVRAASPTASETSINKATTRFLGKDSALQLFNRGLNRAENLWIVDHAPLADEAVAFGYLNATAPQAKLINRLLAAAA